MSAFSPISYIIGGPIVHLPRRPRPEPPPPPPASRATPTRSTDPVDVVKIEPEQFNLFRPVGISPKYYFRMRFYDYKKPIPRYGLDEASISKTDITPLTYQIDLPIPLSLYDQANISYESKSLALLGDMSELLQGFVGAANGGAENLKQFLGDQLQKKSPAVINRLVYEIAPNFLNGVIGGIPGIGDIAATIQQSFGAAVNPNEAAILQGPPLRSWSFRWLFIPHNRDESVKIQELIRELKARSLPYVARSKTAPDDNVTGLLAYPQICLINMYPWDENGQGLYQWTDKSIIKIKRTVITGVNVQYNSQGSPAFFRETHNPVSIDLTLSFKEIEYFLSEDEYVSKYQRQPVQTPGQNFEDVFTRAITGNSEESG